MTTEYNLEDTRIEIAGVCRCCLATVAEEYKDKKVMLGDKSQCLHCKTPFTLIKRKGSRPSWWTKEQWNRPVWTPDWQLKDKETL